MDILMPLLFVFKRFRAFKKITFMWVTFCHWGDVFDWNCQTKGPSIVGELWGDGARGKSPQTLCHAFTHTSPSPWLHLSFFFFLLSFLPVLSNRLAATSELELLCHWCMTNYFCLFPNKWKLRTIPYRSQFSVNLQIPNELNDTILIYTK